MNRSLLAGRALEGAMVSFGLRSLAFGAVLQVGYVTGIWLLPEVAVALFVGKHILLIWFFVRFVAPTMIWLYRHYWSVWAYEVPPDPALSKAIVAEQWSHLGHDLMLPWRAIRG